MRRAVVLKLGGGAQEVFKRGVRDDKFLSANAVSYTCYLERPCFRERLY